MSTIAWQEDRRFPSVLHVKRGNDIKRYVPERTCRDVDGVDKFVCSECGASFDYEGRWDEPTYWVDDVAAVVEYCPNCGAMVIYDV